jgi:hypothetical protein
LTHCDQLQLGIKPVRRLFAKRLFCKFLSGKRLFGKHLDATKLWGVRSPKQEQQVLATTVPIH